MSTVILVYFLILGIFLGYTGGQQRQQQQLLSPSEGAHIPSCSVPVALHGRWRSNTGEMVHINSTHLRGLPTGAAGTPDSGSRGTGARIGSGYPDVGPPLQDSVQNDYLLCYNVTGNYYLYQAVPGQLVTRRGSQQYPGYTYFTCLYLVLISKTVVRVMMLTDDGKRVVRLGDTVPYDEVCKPYSLLHPSRYQILVKQDTALEAVTCPDVFQGRFSYMFSYPGSAGGSVNRKCWQSSLLDVCTQPTTFRFDYSKCAERQAGSISGVLDCIDHFRVDSAGLSYLFLYDKSERLVQEDNDWTMFPRITCYAYRKLEGSGVTRIYATSQQMACHQFQNDTHYGSSNTEFTLLTPYGCRAASVPHSTWHQPVLFASLALTILIHMHAATPTTAGGEWSVT